ncbi:type II toxin-antitoxin system prevent-host-death family antitoxin [Acidobacteria bacterium AH-259-O06]|nr:type II toxin-antitoxin system prevent-host-death family antitoxin [Acidobacteria bacterium AH-259-O06]
MKVADTVELKNKTNELLRGVIKGEPVIIIYRGKPAASLIPLCEDELEDFILEHSPRIRKMIAEAEKERQADEVVLLEDYQSGLKR